MIIKSLKDVIVKMMVWMFIKNVLILHGFLNVIIFDRKSQFVSDFWKKFYKIINMNRRLLTTYYPQTNKMIERINSTMKVYLKIFID